MGAISQLTDSSSRRNQQWAPNQLYQGLVKNIHSDGSIEVLINNKSYPALAHKSAQPGDLLSLSLLGTDPEPHFSIVKVLNRPSHEDASVQIRSAWQEAVTILRRLEPGVSALNALWQRYPEQIAKLSVHLPQLLTAIQNRALGADDLSLPGRLKRQALLSGSFYEADGEVNLDDLKPLLFRILGLLQQNRQLTKQNGQLCFTKSQPGTAQTLQDKSIALYASEQEASSGVKTLKQLFSTNAENAVLHLVSGQLNALSQSNGKNSIWIMQLLIKHQEQLLPVDLEFRKALQVENEQWDATFSLVLPNSGRVHVKLIVKNSTVKIELFAQDEAVLDVWSQNQIALKQMLARVGLQLRQFSCTQFEEA